jgi:hypothetical protein
MMSDGIVGLTRYFSNPSFLCLSQESIPQSLIKLSKFFSGALGTEWISVTSIGMTNFELSAQSGVLLC